MFLHFSQKYKRMNFCSLRSLRMTDIKNQICEEGRGLRMRLVMLLTMGS